MHVIYIHSKSNKMETTVVQRIAFIKKNEKLTNEAFALKTTVPVETIKSMFSKKTNPNLDTIQKIYSAFPHYSLEWIICGTGDIYKKGMNENIKFVLPYVTGYWARHTWATIASELDVPDPIVDIAQGRTVKGMSGTYIARNMKKVTEANRKVLDYVFSK